MVQIAKDVRFFSMSMLFCLLVYYIMCPDPWHILVMFTSPNSQNWSLYRGTETRAASRAMNIEMWAFLVRFKIDSTQHGYAVQVQSLDVSHELDTHSISITWSPYLRKPFCQQKMQRIQLFLWDDKIPTHLSNVIILPWNGPLFTWLVMLLARLCTFILKTMLSKLFPPAWHWHIASVTLHNS